MIAVAWFLVLLATAAYLSVYRVRYTQRESIVVGTIVIVGIGAAAFLLAYYLP
jgi:hypothetical protein